MDSKANWNLKHSQKYYSYLESEMFRSVYEYVAQVSIENNLKTVLDIGCWTGMLPKALQAMGYQGSYLGTDISDRALNEARRTYDSGKFCFKEHDFRDEPTKGQYDLVYFGGIFYYIEDKESFLLKHLQAHDPKLVVVQDLITTNMSFLSNIESIDVSIQELDIPLNAHGDSARNKRTIYTIKTKGVE